MRYELPPYRPPNEARSLLLRATRGCPWNRCTFCSMYKGSRFQFRPVDDLLADIQTLRRVTDVVTQFATEQGHSIEEVALANGVLWLTREGVKTAFIADSNSLIMPVDDLARVVSALREAFPTLERVTCYARAHTVLHRKPEELRRLREAGLSRLHLGLESGDAEVLQRVQKGVTPQQAIEAGLRVKEAGLSLSEYVIIGLGGRERSLQHAQGTARVLNAIDPDFIRVRTLMLEPGAPLCDGWQRGEFDPLGAGGLLAEERELVAGLEVTSQFVSDHFSNRLDLEGRLPQAKPGFLARLDEALAGVGARPARTG
ncbi:MAG: radical SAM protein [Chloroflexi bacterium]|nr:radical SAM protein [Chloroflexota bacterium]